MKNFTKLFQVSLVALALLVAGTTTAQELTISGSVDTYYRANLNASNDVKDDGVIAPNTAFANTPGFSIGMINLIAGIEGEKSGFVADMVFGPRGSDAIFGSPAPQPSGVPSTGGIVNQLYAYWNASDAVTLTIGNFNTFLGYEVISPSANYNYSTSYMFSWGPFSHSGVKADIALGDASLMLGVFNKTDITEYNFGGKYYAGAQLGVAGQYLNILASDDYFQIDFTGGFDLSDATFLGLNATYNNDLFYGVAVYLQQSLSDDFSIGFRGEYFSEEGAGVLAASENVIDLTLSANYSVGALTFIPEFRIDLYEGDEIVPEISKDPLDVQSSLASFVLAAVYSF